MCVAVYVCVRARARVCVRARMCGKFVIGESAAYNVVFWFVITVY